jgi:hypothetical protein
LKGTGEDKTDQRKAGRKYNFNIQLLFGSLSISCIDFTTVLLYKETINNNSNKSTNQMHQSLGPTTTNDTATTTFQR